MNLIRQFISLSFCAFLTIALSVECTFTTAASESSGTPAKGANGPVWNSLKLPDGGAFIMGHFTSVNGSPVTNVARLNAAGNLALNFQLQLSHTNEFVNGILPLSDGKFFVYGSFTKLGSVSRTNIAKILADGRVDETYESDFPSVPGSAAAQPDGSILLTGNAGYSDAPFNGSDGTTNLGAIVRLLPDGRKDMNFATATYPTVRRPFHPILNLTSAENGQFYLNGDVVAWTNLYDTSKPMPQPYRHGLIRFKANGSVDPDFQITLPTTNYLSGPPIQTPTGVPEKIILRPDTSLIVGGRFMGRLNGVKVPGLVRLSPSGILDVEYSKTITASFVQRGVSTNVADFDITPDGSIVGFSLSGFTGQLFTMDATGNVIATKVLPSPSNERVHIYPDKTILVTGRFASDFTGYRFAWFNKNLQLIDPTVTPTAVKTSHGVTTLDVFVRAPGSYHLQTSLDLINWTEVRIMTLNSGEQTIDMAPIAESAFFRLVR